METPRKDVGGPLVTPTRGSLAWLALAYPCLMIGCIVLKPSIAIPGAIWPPHAIAFTAYYLLPSRRWPLVAAVSLSGTLICGGMASVIRLLGRFNQTRQPMASQAPLILLGLALGSLPGSLLTSQVHALAAGVPIDGLDVSVRMLSSVLSVVTLCPLLLGLLQGFIEPAPPTPRRWEAPGLALTIGGLCLFYLLVSWPFDQFLELMLLAVPLLWFALRFSQFACALACAGLSIGVALISAHGFGAFPALVLQGNWQNGVLSTQIFLLLACGEALLINRMVLEQLALLADAARKQAMLLAYAHALDTAEESVRKATAVDLHDGVAQIIAGQGMILSVTDGRTRFGLRNLAERIRVAGGSIEVDSTPGGGCRVAVQLPVLASADA